jgi:SNF2-related domain
MHHFRDYQITISNQANEILQQKKLVVLTAEVRTGKTLMALRTAEIYGAKKVLFITKKKAISSIESDYTNFGFTFVLTTINKESIHKVGFDFDFVVYDEVHTIGGAFPKPSKVFKYAKQYFAHLPMILMSGTLTPESYSQIYHSLNLSNNSPFAKYSNFYKWAKDFVNVKVKYVSYGTCNDYSDANKTLIDTFTKPFIISFTQKEAGFETQVIEHILECEMHPQTYSLINRLKTDLVVQGKNEVILADTGVKLMQKIHQLSSGTVKFESGNSMVTDYSKAVFIKERFANKKIGIFYKFKEELNMLQEIFKDDLTTDLDVFNNSSKNIALQIVSGREGINLSAADYLVFLNIDFSATSYWQSRDRLTTMQRKTNEVYWVFGIDGIEKNIYKSVMNKRDYTLSQFKKDARE